MEKFVIEGGTPLAGTFTPSGNKNAALPALAACLLTREEVLDNLRARIEFCDFVLDRFREIEPDARTGFIEEEQLYPYLALSYGIELMEFMRTWCQETLAQIEAGELPPPPIA